MAAVAPTLEDVKEFKTIEYLFAVYTEPVSLLTTGQLQIYLKRGL